MFLVAWTIKDPREKLERLCLTDHYSAHGTIDEARKAFEKIMSETDLAGNGPDRYSDRGSIKEKHPQETPNGPFLYSASITAVIKSTDYEALSFWIKSDPMDGEIVEGKDDDDESEELNLGVVFRGKFEKDKQPVRPSNPKAIP